MGNYVYRTTTTSTARVVVRNEQTGNLEEIDVSVYHFAYKESLFRGSDNARLDKKIVDPVREAFKRRDKKPHRFGILAHNNEIELGNPVFRTRRNVSVNDCLVGSRYPKYGILVRVVWKGNNITWNSLKKRLDEHGLGQSFIRLSPGPQTEFTISKKENDYVLMATVVDGSPASTRFRYIPDHVDNEYLLKEWQSFQDDFEKDQAN